MLTTTDRWLRIQLTFCTKYSSACIIILAMCGSNNNNHTHTILACVVRHLSVRDKSEFFSGRPFDSSIIQRLVQFRCKHGISISSSRRKANSIGITCWLPHCSASGQQSGKDKPIFFINISLLMQWKQNELQSIRYTNELHNLLILILDQILTFVVEIHRNCQRNRCISVFLFGIAVVVSMN